MCLELFDQLNTEMIEKEMHLSRYYDEIKNNIVKVLNEIVENYVYRNPKKSTYEGGRGGRERVIRRAGAELRVGEEGE